MKELLDKTLTEMRGAWRFRRYALATAWIVCLLGWLVVFAIPDTYEARARVNVDTRTALTNVLEGQVIRQDFESQLNLIRQALLGRTNLEYVAQQVGMELTAMQPAQRDAVLNSLTQRIEIALEPPATRDPRIPNTLYRITIRDGNRDTALKVVDVLLNSFVEGSMRSDRTGTATAERFLREQLAEYGKRLADAEGQLAEFKKKNVGLVPGDQGDYFQRLTTQITAAQDLQAQLVVATSRRDELQRQLRGEAPFVPTGEGATGATSGPAGPQDTASRIADTQARLDDLLLRFTDRHPDVIAARETLEQLRVRQKEELAALRRGDAGVAATTGARANPVRQNIQLQLNQVGVEIAALRTQIADRRRNEADLRRVIDTVPEVEAEFQRLTRDYDVTRSQYNSLLERLERARLSGDAEQTGTVKFNIVDPPSVSFRPIFPNRPLLLAAVLLAGLGAGCGLAYLIHLIKPVFSSSRSLMDATGLQVLGTVMRGWVDRERAELRGGLMRYVAASGALFVVFMVVMFVEQPASRMVRNLLEGA
jgi:polysaccharide chain length determinant protein (PEP-CTERM system associated)